ncbi:MAG: leucine-rich repeat domain-containing protein [candidate division Zixibacteria bacterium]|nr:leucine-rich repeat domain-containing protein [candidate division Zixibacteria bacterium]
MKPNKLVLLPIAVLVLLSVLWTGCSEKSVNQTPGDTNIAMSVSVQTPSLLPAVTNFRLTVFGVDMDTIRTTMDLVDGHILVGEVEVPVGPRRTFVLQAIETIVSETPGVTERVIYTGIQVMDIRPGVVNNVQVVLKPAVPLVRVTPRRTDGISGEPFSIEVTIHNLPQLYHLTVQLYYDYQDVWPTLVRKPETLPQQVVLSTRGINDGTAFEIDLDGLETNTSITNATGNATAAFMEFGTYGRVGSVPELELIDLYVVAAYGPLGIPIPLETVFEDDGEVLLELAQDQVVVFPDAALESEIRYLTGVEAGDIMLSDVIDITSFSAIESSIDTLEGMQHLRNLDWLELGWSTGPVDLSPLSSLSKLNWFYFNGMDQVDIAPLANLTALYHLDLYWNEIQNIAPLANLTRLSYLNLQSNNITDVSALSGLLSLHYLNLGDNLLTDLQPLVLNQGLMTGDTVDVTRNTGLGNSTVQAQVAALRGRGVTVFWDGIPTSATRE